MFTECTRIFGNDEQDLVILLLPSIEGKLKYIQHVELWNLIQHAEIF